MSVERPQELRVTRQLAGYVTELDIFEIDIKKIKTYEKDRIFVQKNLDLYV